METLSRILNRPTDNSVLLPDVFPSLHAKGIRFRRGQVSIIAGPPNAGKSFFALILVAGMGVPVLYFSADTDSFTMFTRAAALATGEPISQVERAVLDETGQSFYADAIERLAHLVFVFDSSPSVDDIDAELQAYVEVHGEAPAVVVIDNLINVQGEHGDEWTGLRSLIKQFHYLARESNAHVMVLHHTSESSEYDPTKPAPRRALMGKLAQLPELIVTVAMSGSAFGVCGVKNRNSSSDPTGRDATWFHADPSRMALSETIPDEFRRSM